MGQDSNSKKHNSRSKSAFKRRIDQEKKSVSLFWSKYKKTIITALLVMLVLAVIICALMLINAEETREMETLPDTTLTPEDEAALIFYEPEQKWYKLRDDVETILLIGIDKYEEDLENPDDTYINTQQNDFNLLIAVDHTDKSYRFIPINRDTMTEVNHIGINAENMGSKTEQLALAHTYGTGHKDSCRNVTRAVENLFYGIEIDHYVGFTMDLVPIVTDECDGVTVRIKDDFSKVNKNFIKGKDYTLTGKDVMDFIRSRKAMEEDPTNTARMERQKDYIEALRSRAESKMNGSGTWALKTVKKVIEYMFTDYYYEDLAMTMDQLNGYEYKGTLDIEGSVTYKDYAEFYPDEAALKAMLIKLFYTETEVN